MINQESVSSLHKSGFNCAQVVATLCSELSNTAPETAKAAMGGFGGGVRCGEVCGAVAGAVFSLGMAFPYTDGENLEAKAQIADLTIRLTNAFRDKYGVLACRDLLERFGKPSCEEFMAYAAQLAADIIAEKKSK